MADSFKALSEGDVGTEAQWVVRLAGEDHIFRELLADGILRNSGTSSGKRIFSLNFVGLLSVGSHVWFAFPKASSLRLWSDAELVLKAIGHYRRRSPRALISADFSPFADRRYGGTLIDAFLSLIGLSLDRGFHYQEVVNTKALHDGIDWGRTISETTAIHTNTSVIYPDAITRVQSRELSELAEVQAFALLDIQKRLASFSKVLAPNLDELWEQCRSVLEHGTASFHPNSIEHILEHYSAATNRDEDLELTSNLFDWFRSNWKAGTPLIAYGITSFHTVWEDICIQAMSAFGDPVSHAEIASQPSYEIAKHDIPLSPQRPDILRRKGNDILIADAKWYLLDKKILPQTPDAIKQIAYELTIDPSLVVKVNLLLLPSEDEEPWTVAGVLHLFKDGSSDSRFRPVTIISLNWKLLVEGYLRHEQLSEKLFEEAIGIRDLG